MVNGDIPGPADVAGADVAGADVADGLGSGAEAVPGGTGGSGADAVPGGAGSGAQRGRPRSQEADRAILTATVELLADRGLAAMSIEEVAARAGVGKTTIYRRWPSKGLLALDAFVRSFREEQPLPDTGTLRGDLLAALTAYVRAVTQTPMGAMLTSLIAEAQHDPELRGAWRDRVIEPLRSQHRIMLERAVARGEIPASVDAEVVLDLFFGAAEHRLLLGHLPMTDAFIGTVVDVILDGIQPGGADLGAGPGVGAGAGAGLRVLPAGLPGEVLLFDLNCHLFTLASVSAAILACLGD